ncbi:MAG: helix-turn-helix transcriptional regulator [Planctomycetes bacterium]|nr:helix-turn-helix transcriptional regulator [Planctomycetota bacterium]
MRGKNSVAAMLKKMRLLRGLKQRELAHRTGLQPSAISQFETGHREPSIDNLRKLADALGVSIDFLMGRQALIPSGPQLEKILRHARQMTQEQLEELARFAAFLSNQMKARPRLSAAGALPPPSSRGNGGGHPAKH